MSLQRLLVYSPLAALVVACLAVRVASEQTARRHNSPAPAQNPAATEIQEPHSVESGGVGTATSWLPRTQNVPPADVPGLSGMEKAVTPTSKSNIGDQNTIKATTKIGAKFNAPAPGDASLQELAGRKSVGQSSSAWKLAAQTPLRKPEVWTPPSVYGPPLPPERIHVQKQAHQLRADLQAGRITLVMDDRDGGQLEELEWSGVYGWPAPPPKVVVRSDKQRSVLAGTTENSDLLPKSSRLQIASRSGELDRTALNPADDPDFDPCAVPPSPLLLRLLTTLAGRSTSTHPLQILSLLRPPYRMAGYIHVGPANPHSMGLAADIGAYGGHEIRQSDPQACVAATLALLRDLPPGRYRLGLPKAPEGGWDMPPALIALLDKSTTTPSSIELDEAATGTKKHKQPDKSAANTPNGEAADEKPIENTTACAISALYGLYASSAKPAWPFFPPPFTQVVATDVADGDAGSKPARTALRFQNEAYAPEEDLTDVRLRKALEQARKRGVDIVAMFPDGADHIHVDVRQNP